MFVSAAGELRVQRGMPGGWSLDAEMVWFRLVRSDFRVWQEAPLLLVGSIARGGGSAVSSVLFRLVASVLPHSVRWMRACSSKSLTLPGRLG